MCAEFYYLEQEVSSPKTQSGKAAFQNSVKYYQFIYVLLALFEDMLGHLALGIFLSLLFGEIWDRFSITKSFANYGLVSSFSKWG